MISFRSTRRTFAFRLAVRTSFLCFVGCSLLAAGGISSAQELGTARLQIAGTRLTISPATQTVPLETSTLVETHLEGYDPDRGVLPGDLRVVADFTGPGLEGGLRLEAFPNEPLRVPALRTKGEYFLENIRLVQGDDLLTYAEPRTASILATQILISSVSTRALTEDEIRNYGIVIGDDSRQAINLTFAFGFAGETIEYSMPVVFRHFGPEDWGRPAELQVPFLSGRTVNLGRYQPPRPVPFTVQLDRDHVRSRKPTGGCEMNPCREEAPPEPPMVGVVFFPAEMSLLHQFFSVVLMVQNGAPDGDPLTISDLTARIQVPSGLRQASTEPPTPLGVPVPVRVPGADGEVGTSDDLTLLVAQATGQAEFLVEGLEQGTHIVDFDMEGLLQGLPEGPTRITGSARGAVTVRDPTLSATISHPTVVRENTQYSAFFTVSNLGNQPVNGIEIKLPTSGLAGTRLADGETNVKDLGSLLPGESSSVEFNLVALMSGKLVATSTRAGSGVLPLFEFSLGVGNGIPLSPESISLPESVDALPPEFVVPAKSIVGLAHSLSTAPWELVRDRPQVSRNDVDERVYRLVEAARMYSLGEPLFETVASFMTEWAGGRDGSWEWDELRRTIDPALELAEFAGATLQVTEPDADLAVERFAEATYGFEPWIALARYGEIEVASRVSGKSSHGFLDEAVRDLPFAELFPLNSAEIAFVTQPEDEGHRVVVRRQASGGADLRLILPSLSDGDMRSIAWNAVSLDAGGSAWVDVVNDGSVLQLQVDGDADGVAEYEIPGTETSLAPRPFEAVVARQNRDIDPSGHVVDVLFSRDVALRSLIPRDPERFQIPGRESNGGITPTEQSYGGGILGLPQIDNPFEGLSNPRVVRVVFNNPLGPFEQHQITISDLESATDDFLASQTLPLEITVDQPGIRLEGTVIDSYGQPLPFARVTLLEQDMAGVVGQLPACKEHATAVTIADAEGRYSFDYVRQTACTDVFRVRALAPGEPRWGEMTGRVRFPGETQQLDVVMVGRATVEGRVTYEDGSAPVGLTVTARNPVFNSGRVAWNDDEGNYRMAEVMVGTVQLTAWDELGNQVFQTIEVPTAGARIERDLVLIRRQEGTTTGTVRGRVVRHSTSEPESDAYVVLYLDGQFQRSLRSDYDGTFDFGTVPTGLVELQAFDGLSGLEGAQFFTDLTPDQVIDQELRLTNDRGTIIGRVVRVATDGTQTPVADAVVWVVGLPENTTTDSNGDYRLEDVVLGTHQVQVADLATNESVQARVTLDSSSQEARADLFFREGISLHGAVTGTVLDRDGLPVSGASVHLGDGYYGIFWHHEDISDSAGRFRLDDVLPGTYAIHAQSGNDGGISFVDLSFPGDVEDATVQFAGGVLRGRTFYTSPEQLEVPVVSTIYYRRTRVVHEWGMVSFEPDWNELRTNEDGTFEIEVLKGPYQIIAFNSFHGSKRSSGFFDEFSEELEIEFDRNGSISGTVLLHDGVTPAAGAEVTLQGGTISDFTVQTDENGRFFFDLLKKGGYKLTAAYEPGAIFRTQRVWAELREAGDVLDNVDIVLPMQGSVEGWVEDADGLRVPGAVVELSERSFPWRRIRQTTDGEGNYLFGNIFVGDVTLAAQAPALDGLGTSISLEITDEGQEVQSLLTLEGVGSIRGTITSPETGGPVANARVRLINGALKFHDATTSDLDGSFTFERLALGSYRVAVFDPTTGRHGEGEFVEVTHHGHEANGDVTLEVRGIVDGHIYDPPSNNAVPGATIRLKSWGLRWFTAYSSADTGGYFTFEGIPEGPFDLEARVDGRKAENSGEIVEEDEIVTRDLYLQALASIRGVVLGPRGADGLPGAVMDDINVSVRRGNAVVAAGTENPFLFEQLLPTSGIVTATEFGSGRLVTKNFRLEEGDEQEVELVMRAMGSSTVQVLSSTGDPVPYAQVSLRNGYSSHSDAAPGGRGNARLILDKTADENGWVTFESLHEGALQVSAEDPGTGLVGSEGALLTYEGEVVPIVVQLQPSGTIRGTVLMPDGSTPGVGITVALKVGNGWQVTETDASGVFEFTSMPIRNYVLHAQDPEGPGSYSTSFSLQSDQEILDLSIILDDEDPYVVSMTPTSMSRDVPVNTQVVLRFNEPMLACTSCNSHFAFQRVQGGYVSFSVVWSEDDSVATLVPSQPLDSATTYRVQVKNNVTDRAGRFVDPLFTGGLTTADIVPPSVIDTEPQHDAVQVPATSTITLQFSEPVDLDSLSGAFQVTDLTTGQPITVTTLVRLDETGVVLTPLNDFELDHEIEVRASGVADPSGNVQSGTFVMSFWTPDVSVPEVEWIRPSTNQTFTAGDLITFEARVTDNQGTARVRFELDEWSSPWLDAQVEPGAPGQPTDEVFSSQLPAPIRDQAGDVVVSTVAEDIWGNVAISENTIRVEPLVNQSPPVLAESCPADADFVAPGLELTTTFTVTDDLGIESAWLEVDGQLVDQVIPVVESDSTVNLSWTPDAQASPDQVFALEFFARDFAGNVTSRQQTARVPSVPLTAAGDSFVGSSIYLSAGDHVTAGDLVADEIIVLDGAEWTAGPLDIVSATTKVEIQCGGFAELGEVEAATVRVERGGTLRTPRIEPFRVTAALFEVEDGALIDGVGRGYYGVKNLSDPTYGPPGLPLPGSRGASHGGRGGRPGFESLQPVYDSVYVPTLAGAGGDDSGAAHAGRGGDGGGVVDIQADQLIVDGRIDVRGRHGGELGGNPGNGGAGGSVLIDTAALSGSGWIGARGGDGPGGSGGGGGRIAIHAGQLSGFDPALQTMVHGGGITESSDLRAGPGTVLVRTSGESYGRLYLQNLTESGEPLAIGVTDLPVLGSGSVDASQPQGADRWVFGSGNFDIAWLGAWMRLEDGSGADLGTYRVLEVDETRVLLEGASAVAGAVTFQGVYLFDEVHALGVDLQTDDTLQVEGEVVLGGTVDVRPPLDAGSLTVAANAQVTVRTPWNVEGDVHIRSGAVLRPFDREFIEIAAGGRMELEAGAWIDVDARGYFIYEAPEGLVPDADGSGGGSHGGHGAGDLPLDVYDSVYEPELPGGGGATGGVTYHSEGGGVVILRAGEMILDGEITARSRDFVTEGAGGSIRIHTETLSGSGRLDASPPEGASQGAGGRVAIWAGQMVGFDPVEQSRTAGAGTGTLPNVYGAAGTLFVHTGEANFGRLVIDNGLDENDQPRPTPVPTVLPTLDVGAVSSASAEAADLRLDLGAPALRRWAGAYIQLFDAGGALLGEYRTKEPTGTTLLVEGAGSLASQVASYAGVYRFDRIDILNGAQLDWPDATPVDEVVISSKTLISSPIEARTIQLTAEAALRPSGRQPVDLRASESIVVEAGAIIDASGAGYEGFNNYGLAPDGIAAAGEDSGGSHGGGSLGPNAGEVYDSVYFPTQAGASGGRIYGDGGGVIVLEAPLVSLDGVLDATGVIPNQQRQGGAGGTVRIEAGTFQGSGRILASGWTEFDQSNGGGGRVALWLDELVGFDPATQIEARPARSLGSSSYPDYVAAGTIFVHTSASTFGDLLVDSRGLDERDPADGIVRKSHPTELPALGAGVPASVAIDGTDLLLDLGVSSKPRWLRAWVELLDMDGAVLGQFQVGSLEGNTIRVVGAAEHEASVTGYRGTYRFDKVEVRGGAGLQAYDPTYGTEILLGDDVEFGGPVRGGDFVVEAGSLIHPLGSADLVLDADTSVVVEAGATLSVVGRSPYDPDLPAPANVAGDSTTNGSHGGFGIDSSGEIYGSVYFPRFGGALGSVSARGGGSLHVAAPTVQIDGLLDASPEYGTPNPAGGTITVDSDHLSGNAQIVADGIHNGGGGRVAVRASQSLDFDIASQVSAAGGIYGSTLRGGAGTIFVMGPTSTWGDLRLDNGQAGLSNQDTQPYGHLPRLGTGIVGLVEADSDQPANLWIEPSASGIVFDLGVEGMWFRSGGSDYRILEEDGSRRRILLEGAAGLVQVGDAYGGLYRFDSLTAVRGSYLKIDDASEVGEWTIDGESAVQAASLAIDVEITSAADAVEGEPYTLTATFLDQELGQSHAATIDWGDGSVETGTVADGDAGSVSGQHTWPQDGSYLVELCVGDSDGRVGCASQTILVANADPEITFPEPPVQIWNTVATENGPATQGTNQPFWTIGSSTTYLSQSKVNAVPTFALREGPMPWRVAVTLDANSPWSVGLSGLAMGYVPGDAQGRAESDYLLLAWDHSYEGAHPADPGLHLYRVQGAPELWTMEDGAGLARLASAATLGSESADALPHVFEIERSDAHLRVWVDGALEFDLAVPTDPDGGSLAYWNHGASMYYRDTRVYSVELLETESVVLTGSAADSGPEDLHTGTVDWGDGSAEEPLAIVQSSGTVEFATPSHAYQDQGQYYATICLQDEDGGEDCSQRQVAVVNGAAVVTTATMSMALGSVAEVEAATFVDGPDDTHSASIDWGDGAGPEAATVEVTGPGQGRVLVAPPLQVGQWQADVCVIDDDGAVGCDVFDLTVEGVATPTVTSIAATGEEGSTTSLTATFSDADPEDVHTATVDWGGGPVAAAVDQATDSVTASSTFMDDGSYPVTVCVTDLGGLSHCLAGTADVSNTAPVVAVAAGSATADEGSSLTLADASFADAGVEDTHTADIDWGDGSSEATATTGGGGTGTITGLAHVYENDGTYQISVCASDDEGAQGCGTVDVTVANVAPVVTAVGSVALDGVSELELVTYADAGVADLHTATIDWADGTAVEAGTVEVTGAGQGRVLGDHDYASGGIYDIQVCVTDDGGGTSCDTVEVSSADSVAPTVGVSGVAAAYSAGETLTATITTSDEVGVERVEVSFDGTFTTLTEGGPTFVYQTQVDPTLTTPRTTSLDVVAYDFSGNVSTPYSQSVDLGVDLPPNLSLAVTPDRADGRYTAGEAVTFVAEASDNVAVASLTIDIDGEVTSGSSPLTVSWTAPSVSQPTPVSVTAVATDNNGNSSTETLNLQVDPSASGIPPEVAFRCPTDGATLPSAYDLTLQLTATDDEAVTQVDLYRDDEATPFATAVPGSGGTVSFDVSEVVTLPAVVGAAQAVRFRAVASDAAFNFTSTEITLQVVETVDLETSGNDWNALAGSIGVLRSGTLEIDQPRTLAGLVVLPGATLSHPQAASGAETALDLTVNGPVYVACGGSLDATAKGYSGQTTYPGESTSVSGTGGSHIGQGGPYSSYEPGSSYGSLYLPGEPGAGGGNSGSGLAGGGVIDIEATELVVDGAIRANGGSQPSGGYRGGAGGSIRLDIDGPVSGGGTVEVVGGEVPGGYAAGGGGAIAVYHAGLDASLTQALLAQGSAEKYPAGAGSVYLFGPTSTYGDLLIDAGSVVDGITDLPSLGSGSAAAGTAGNRVETGGPVQPFFVGHWVELFDSAGTLEGTWRVESIDGDALVLEAGATADVGDSWQGVYRFDNVDLVGDIELRSTDPIRVGGQQTIDGMVETERITAHDLVLRTASTLTHPATTDPADAMRLVISLSGNLTIESGATIDVTAKGFTGQTSYPGESVSISGTGGSHLGQGGLYSSYFPGSTFGSVYFPREQGAGGGSTGSGLAGGGAVFVEAAGLVLDGSILANGESRLSGAYRGGAGGSIWLDISGPISGTGTVEVVGGEVPAGYAAGGGGAIAIYHGGLDTGVAQGLLAQGSAEKYPSGAGAIYLFGPASTFGDLAIATGAVADGITELPSLGAGTAQTGSSGSRLETELASIPSYFVGHWVEIYDPTGALEGTWRVQSIDGTALVLDASATVDPGDDWQGVYRFDDVELMGDVELRSNDPIRYGGEQVIDGSIETERITGHDLVLRTGSTLTHPMPSDPADALRLEIFLDGRLTIEAGATIDVTGRGYGGQKSYPGESVSVSGTGASHLGRGGLYSSYDPGSSYGSVYFPLEAGAGGGSTGSGLAGGGVVYIAAAEAVVDGAILANGESVPTGGYRGGAGGSIWLDVTGPVSGTGTLEVRGGDVASYGAGGGGAIAVYHGGLDAGLEANLLALGGATAEPAGAGAVYLFGPTATYGDLIVDTADVLGGWTELPALGAGVAQAASGADVLVTDLPSAVQPYFVGHWVEIYDGATSALEGTYRIAEVLPDGLSLVLEPNGVDLPAVDPGDLWEGVYLFDNVLLTGDAVGFQSDDPILVTGTQTIRGTVTTERIFAGALLLDTGALLTHPPEDGASRGLDIRLSGDLTIGTDAAIDVSGQGYGPRVAHPSAAIPGGGGGGSHLGLGGYAAGSTYGSVITPWEHGGGGEHASAGGLGGGRIRIQAADLIFVDATGSIRADGISTTVSTTRGGAGGSIWIDLTGQVQGDGTIGAIGGASGTSNYGSGGGGGIAVYHQGSTGSALTNLAAWGGDNPDIGGAGTLFVHGPTSTEGDLIVRSAGTAGLDTVLPSLGGGTAQTGSSGTTLVTDLASTPPDYFIGHFVEISTAGGTVKGTFPILSIAGATLELAEYDGVVPSVDETDTWRGVYRFDTVTVDKATLTSSDGIFESGTEVMP